MMYSNAIPSELRTSTHRSRTARRDLVKLLQRYARLPVRLNLVAHSHGRTACPGVIGTLSLDVFH